MKSFTRHISPVSVFALIVSAYLLPCVAQAQSTQMYGFPSSDKVQAFQYDQIDTQSGKVSVDIPLYSLPQKGSLSFSVSLRSMTGGPFSGNCDAFGNNCTPSIFAPGAGVASVLDQIIYTEGQPTCTYPQPGPNGYTYASPSTIYCSYPIGVADVSGIHAAMYDSSDSRKSTARTYDGTAYMVKSSTGGANIVDRNGIVYSQPALSTLASLENPPPRTITDPNGNQIVLSTSSVTDSVGRTFPEPPGANLYNFGASNQGAQYTFPASTSTVGCPAAPGSPSFQPLVGSTSWQPPMGSGAETNPFLFCYVSVLIRSPSSPRTEGYLKLGSPAQVTLVMLQSVVLPDGTAWFFEYDAADANNSGSIGYGDLVSITEPAGGSISYTYTNTNSGNLSMRVIQSRTTNDGNGHTATWQYTIGSPGAGSPTFTSTIHGPAVLQPNGQLGSNDVVDTYGLACGGSCGSYVLQSEATYQGSATGGSSPLQTVTPSYQFGLGTTYSGETISSGRLLYTQTTSSSTAVTGVGTSVTNIGYPETFSGFVILSQQSCTNYPNQSSCSPPQYTYPPATYPLGIPRSSSTTDFDGQTILSTQTTTPLWTTTGATASLYYQANLIILPSSVVVSGPLNRAETDYRYDENNGSPQGAHGNATTVGRVAAPGSSVSTHVVYTSAGVPSQITDPNGNVTQVNSFQCQGMFPQSITLATGTFVAETTSQQMDCNTGALLSSTDPNGVVTSYLYNDPLNRLTQVSSATGTNTEAHATYSYSPNQVSEAQDQNTKGDGVLHSTAFYDGLGRVIRQVQPNGAIVDTSYDAIGHISSVSNPHGAAASATDGTTSYAYDTLGRMTRLCNPDNGSNIPCLPGNSFKQWSYSGNTVAATDEANNTSTKTFDALGRLTRVVEPSSLSTSYSYDVLGNLWNVVQAGTGTDTPRLRSFSYDSLSRLGTATNPETGTVSYSYLASGVPCSGEPSLPCSKTDARGVTTSYSYDSLNRPTYKHYSDGTLLAAYGYDGNTDGGGSLQAAGAQASTNAVGRLTSVSNTVNAATAYSYDAQGRTVLQQQVLPSTASWATQVAASYDLAGNMTDLLYPDGRHVKQTFDSAGRLLASGDNGALQNYIESIGYNPDGSLSTTTSGNGIVQSVVQNSRMQVSSMNVRDPLAGSGGTTYLNHTYCYSTADCPTGGVANNGNIWQIADTLNPTRTQSFIYDGLNRISSFSLGGVLNQRYGIDSFGNMSPFVGSNPLYSFDPATNRIANLPCSQSAVPYDAAGNQLCDTDTNGALRSYAWDAEDRIASISVQNSGTDFAKHLYGADGARVRKTNADGTFTEYVDFAGQPIAEKDQTGAWTDYIYANGKKIAMAPQQENVLQVAGSYSGGWTGVGLNLSAPAMQGYTFRAGDVLNVRQRKYGANVHGGILIFGNNIGSYFYDQNGQRADDDALGAGTWHNRRIPLDGLAWTVYSGIRFGGGTSTDYNFQFASITVSSADGSVRTIYDGGTNGVTASVLNDGSGTRFYTSDHLGSSQMEFSSSGAPLSASQFMPYGGEINPPVTTNHYKFTGKERDTESGLDYFGARYYGSSMGRFTSPDWSASASPLPYAIPEDPQTLNLYSYAKNSPLVWRDMNGHLPCGGGDADIVINVYADGSSDSSQSPDCDFSPFQVGMSPVGPITETPRGIFRGFRKTPQVTRDGGRPNSHNCRTVLLSARRTPSMRMRTLTER